MGRPKLKLTQEERVVHRAKQVAEAYQRFVAKDPDRAKEKVKNQKDIYRQEHPEYCERQAKTKRLKRAKEKEEAKALRRLFGAKAMKEQAKEPAMIKKIRKCFRC